jgi:hypothetical protein
MRYSLPANYDLALLELPYIRVKQGLGGGGGGVGSFLLADMHFWLETALVSINLNSRVSVYLVKLS